MTTSQSKHPPRPEAEFDSFAPDYSAGMDNPLKAMLGDSAEQFVAVKLRWMLRHCPALRRTGEAARVLDYGCGLATMLRLMAKAGVRARLAGCDVSAGMLEEAARVWPQSRPDARPELRLQHGAVAPFPDGSFDLIVVSAVLHHVPPPERDAVYAELLRLLRPGGEVVVFEHNPWNPVTRYVVARTPIDRHAILLSAAEVTEGLAVAGAASGRVRYLMFAPPRFSALAPLDAALGWLPLGAQYVVTASRAARGP